MSTDWPNDSNDLAADFEEGVRMVREGALNVPQWPPIELLRAKAMLPPAYVRVNGQMRLLRCALLDDGRWLANVGGATGMHAFGQTAQDAITAALMKTGLNNVVVTIRFTLGDSRLSRPRRRSRCQTKRRTVGTPERRRRASLTR